MFKILIEIKGSKKCVEIHETSCSDCIMKYFHNAIYRGVIGTKKNGVSHMEN